MRTSALISMLALWGATTCLAADADRLAAQWVIHMGGTVILYDRPGHIGDITQLPVDDFEIRVINLTEAVVPPLELKRIGNLPKLK